MIDIFLKIIGFVSTISFVTIIGFIVYLMWRPPLWLKLMVEINRGYKARKKSFMKAIRARTAKTS